MISCLLTWILLCTCGSLFLVFLYLKYTRRPKNLPSGPIGIPILGYLPYILWEPKKQIHFSKLCKQYGPVISFYLGNHLTVVLGDYSSIKKAFVVHGDTFSGRPKEILNAFNVIPKNNLLNTDGEPWKEHRRFALSTFKNYGFGKKSLEPMIINEIFNFLKEIEKEKNSKFDITRPLSISVCNNICILAFGKRFDCAEESFQKLQAALSYNLRYGGKFQIHNIFSGLLALPGRDFMFPTYAKRQKNIELINAYMKEQIQRHQKRYSGTETSDYIYAYFTERNERIKNGNKAELFDDDTLAGNLGLFFAAGMDTTTSTLRWGLLYLVLNPEIQTRVQLEIDEVIGKQRMPSIEDRKHMPFTDATLMEIHRMGSVVPLSIPHRTTADVEIGGYLIPKDTMVIPNLWAVHHDESTFPEPMSFRPQRHLDENGHLIKQDHIIPFSLGKRFCPGESLARMELFLYLTAMLQRFTFKKPEGTVLTTGSISTTINFPLSYDLTIEVRE